MIRITQHIFENDILIFNKNIFTYFSIIYYFLFFLVTGITDKTEKLIFLCVKVADICFYIDYVIYKKK